MSQEVTAASKEVMVNSKEVTAVAEVEEEAAMVASKEVTAVEAILIRGARVVMVVVVREVMVDNKVKPFACFIVAHAHT